MAEKLDLRTPYQKRMEEMKERICTEFQVLRGKYNEAEYSNQRLIEVLATNYDRDDSTIRRWLQAKGVIA